MSTNFKNIPIHYWNVQILRCCQALGEKVHPVDTNVFICTLFQGSCFSENAGTVHLCQVALIAVSSRVIKEVISAILRNTRVHFPNFIFRYQFL